MQRNLMVFYSANSSLAGLVACMRDPAFWQGRVVVAMSVGMTVTTINPRLRKTYLVWLGGLGAASALVAAVFGTHGNSLSGVGSILGLILGLTAIGVAVHIFRAESAELQGQDAQEE